MVQLLPELLNTFTSFVMTLFTKFIIQARINAPIEKVWEALHDPKQVKEWNFASEDWHSPGVGINDLQVGGKFIYHMEAKDGRAGFDFGGTYTEITEPTSYAYVMDDGRTVVVTLKALSAVKTEVQEVIDAETSHPVEYQQHGWQAILDNCKKFIEKL